MSGEPEPAAGRDKLSGALLGMTFVWLGLHEPEFSDWKWFGLDELPGLIVPFKRPTYQAVIEGFRSLVTGKI